MPDTYATPDSKQSGAGGAGLLTADPVTEQTPAATATTPMHAPRSGTSSQVPVFVEYVLPSGKQKGEIRHAIVVGMGGLAAGMEYPTLQLQVFTDALNDFDYGEPGSSGLLWATSVPYAADKTTPGSWHLSDAI